MCPPPVRELPLEPELVPLEPLFLGPKRIWIGEEKEEEPRKKKKQKIFRK